MIQLYYIRDYRFKENHVDAPPVPVTVCIFHIPLLAERT